MSRKTLATALVALMALSAAATAEARKSDEPASREVKGLHDVEGEIVGDEIAGSPFTKLQIGMSFKQVGDILGDKTTHAADCGEYMTGKSFIPFHFGGDKVRTECAIKSLGRLVFTNQSDFDGQKVLIKIEYDASEDGYRD